MVYADEIGDADEIAELDAVERGRASPTRSWRWPSSSSTSLAADVRARALPRQLPREGARPDRAQGRRRGRLVAEAPTATERRQGRSTSWPRSRRASPRPRRPASAIPAGPRRAPTPTRTTRRRGRPGRQGRGQEGGQEEGDRPRRRREEGAGQAAPTPASRPEPAPTPSGRSPHRGRRSAGARSSLSNLDKVLYPDGRVHQGPR